jgi:cell division protein ZipA
MMHEPMLLIALAVLVGLAAMLLMNGARKRRLKVKIEPVPTERLDNTPVRSEILSEVRIRERADALRLENEKIDAPLAATESVPAAAHVHEAVHETAQEAAAAEQMVEQVIEVPAPPVVKLSQADLFPEEILAPKVPVAESLETSAQDLAIDRVFSIHVMATTQLFEGRQLLELLLQYGLRFGDMDIFHRHEHPTGQGDILFSMAQAVEPGTFNIDSLSRDLVPGVSFFMSLPGKKSTLAFDLMTDTARRLAYELQADLLDANSHVLTQAELDQWREAVVSYERQQYQSL